MKARIIAIANQKGGVAKTTSVAAIAAVLAELGNKVLIVDLDTQANLTSMFIREEAEETISGAMRGKYPLPQIQIKSGLYIVPASAELGEVERDLATTAEREFILRDLLQSVAPNYSYILLDCPPALNLITRNAFVAASNVFIPMTAEALPASGLQKVEALIAEVKQYNKVLRLGGVFITRWESSRLSRTIENLLRQTYREKVFTTKIRKNIAIAEAPLLNMEITEYAPGSNGAKDYRELTKEFIGRIK